MGDVDSGQKANCQPKKENDTKDKGKFFFLCLCNIGVENMQQKTGLRVGGHTKK